MKKFLLLITLLALVVFIPHEMVNAVEKQNIEILECDFDGINDVEFEITKTGNHSIMFVEVAISYGVNQQGVKSFEGSKSYNNHIFIGSALYINDNPIKEAKTCRNIFYDKQEYEQADNKEYDETYWYCSNNYYERLIWLYSERIYSGNHPKLRTNDDRLKFCNLYQEVGISPGLIQVLRI